MMENVRIDLFKQISDFLFAHYRWVSMGSPSGLEPRPINLAIDLLEYQRQYHPLYGRYCRLHGRETRGTTLLDYPPLPVESFKRADICPFDANLVTAEFYSSGTTEGVRSIHKFRDPGLMLRSIVYTFTTLVSGALHPKSRVFSLMPSSQDNPHSSLGYMIDELMRILGSEGSGHFFSMSSGLDVAGLSAALKQASADEAPVHLMGPAFSYVEFLDATAGQNFHCAPGSCLLETGGYKGRVREIPKSELRDMLSERLGIPRRSIYGEYGMCELSSQGYEISALNTRGELPDEGLYIFPGWMKCILYNPDTMSPVLPGHEGQIALLDLCNLDSCAFILTGDIGIIEDLPESLRARVPGHPRHGLRLLGRASTAVPKGCSMAWEDWASRV